VKRFGREAAFWLVMVALAGSLCMFVSMTYGREAGETQAPTGWHRMGRHLPFISADDIGRSAPALGWSVSRYESLSTQTPAEKLSLIAEFPPQSQLFVSLGMEQPGTGSGVLVKPRQAPVPQRIDANGQTQPLSCTGDLRPFPYDNAGVMLERTATGFKATIANLKFQCNAVVGPQGPAVISGLRRATISKLRVDDKGVGNAGRAIRGSPSWTAFWLVLALALVERLFRVRRRISLLTWAPLATCLPLLQQVNSDWLAEAVRIPEDTHGMLVLWALIGTVGLLKIVLLSTRMARWSMTTRAAQAATGACAIGLATIVITTQAAWVMAIALAAAVPLAAWTAHRWLVQPGTPAPNGGVLVMAFGAAVGVAASCSVGATAPLGALYGVMGGLCSGALLWVQVHAPRMRAYNISALALALAIIGCTEVVVRFSPVGPLWNAVDTHRGAGSMSTLIQQFEDLEAAEHRIYPSDGFAVKLPPRSTPVRVACLGASSTGGAFQNDNLNDFFPARMNALLGPDIEVVNQGVGGWTSFHIRLFVDRHLDEIDPDVITIYLGVNERLKTPVPFSDLYDRWKSGNLQLTWTALDSIRLFQGLRLIARAMRPGAGVGVPAENFAENLDAIIRAARERGIPTLVMSEGVRPDPGILAAYFEAMNEAGQAEDVAYLDTAAMLQDVGTSAFIDSNHLTLTGHQAVARAAATELNRLGWLNPR
jgi:lysophospholipase L1-like esterase